MINVVIFQFKVVRILKTSFAVNMPSPETPVSPTVSYNIPVSRKIATKTCLKCDITVVRKFINFMPQLVFKTI